MSWRVADSLDVLRDEIDAAAPDRSTVSDGSIGDAAHASRDSDHNPWVIDADGEGVVRARDFTHDPANGVDCDVLAERIRLLGKAGEHPALDTGAYVIWEGRIASDTEDGEPWDWEPYTGSNAHTKHMHVSVALAAAGYDSTRPWGITDQEDDVTPEDIKAVADAVLAKRIDVKRDGEPVTISVEQVLRETFQRAERVDYDRLAQSVFNRLVGGELLAGHEVDFEKVKQAVKAALREGTG